MRLTKNLPLKAEVEFQNVPVIQPATRPHVPVRAILICSWD